MIEDGEVFLFNLEAPVEHSSVRVPSDMEQEDAGDTLCEIPVRTLRVSEFFSGSHPDTGAASFLSWTMDGRYEEPGIWPATNS